MKLSVRLLAIFSVAAFGSRLCAQEDSIEAASAATDQSTVEDEETESEASVVEDADAATESMFGGGGLGNGFGGSGGDSQFDAFGAVGQVGTPRLIQSGEIMISWAKDNSEVRGFSIRSGEWTPLRVPPQKHLVPVVAGSVAAVKVGNSIAAYSGYTATWDTLSLARNSKAVPSVSHSGLVQVQDGEHLYTFAASHGKWTSPTDEKFRTRSALSSRVFQFSHVRPHDAIRILRLNEQNEEIRGYNVENNRLIVRGRDSALSLLADRIAVLDKKDNTSSWEAVPSDPFQQAISISGTAQNESAVAAELRSPNVVELNSLALARKLRSMETIRDDDRETLQRLVAAALDRRLTAQTNYLQALREKLALVEKTLQVRQQNRQRIISRRVEELLNPDISWDRIDPHTTSSVPDAAGRSAGLLPAGPHRRRPSLLVPWAASGPQAEDRPTGTADSLLLQNR